MQDALKTGVQATPIAVGGKPKFRIPSRQDKGQAPQLAGPFETKEKHHNLMFEPRVVRGNTHSSNIVRKPEPLKVGARQGPAAAPAPRRRPLKLPSVASTQASSGGERGGPAEEWRSHFVNRAEMASVACTTMPVVEYLTDKPDMRECETQTDLLLNKPSVGRRKQPRDPGLVDVGTQIVAEDDLFDFNVEVEPILSVLVTKTLEQARMEVLEEEELKVMKEQRKVFEQKKVSELAEVQRQEANEKRLEQETTRRKLQSELIRNKEVCAHKQLCARMVSKSFLGRLMRDSLDAVEQVGFFEEDRVAQMYSSFLPWLYDEVAEKLDRYTAYSDTVAKMHHLVDTYQTEVHLQALDNSVRAAAKHKQREEDRLQAKEAKRRRKVEERRKLAEEERVQALKAALQASFNRPENLKTRQLVFSDCNGIAESKGKLIVGLPGGLGLELYLLAEGLGRLQELEELRSLFSLGPKSVRNVLKTLHEYWTNNEWKFELGYTCDPQLFLAELQARVSPDEKKEEFEALEKLKSLSNVFEVYAGLKAFNEPAAADLLVELCDSLTFFLRELYYHENQQLAKPSIKAKLAAADDEPAAAQPQQPAGEKGDKRSGQDTKGSEPAIAEVDLPSLEIRSDFSGFDAATTQLVHQGLLEYFASEDKEKVLRLFSFQRYERDQLGGERLPTLVRFKPEPEEKRVYNADSANQGQNQDDSVLDGEPKPKADYQERPWRLKLNPSLAADKKPTKFHQNKFEAKGTAVSLADKPDVLVQHLPLTLQVRKDLVQAAASIVAPKVLKDKQSNLKLLDLLFSLSDSLERAVLEQARKPQDVIVLPNY